LVAALVARINEPDLNVRTAVLKSLNNAAYNIPSAVIEKCNKNEFFNPLTLSLKFRKDLIKEVELGPFKHKIDEGQSVRNAAF